MARNCGPPNIWTNCRALGLYPTKIRQCYVLECIKFYIFATTIRAARQIFIDEVLTFFVSQFFDVHSFHSSNEKDEILFIDDGNTAFDVLIFTQRWPVTGCMEWMEKKRENVCTLPSAHEIWIIHGVWPTRFGSIGPAFCNKTSKFDINTLKPLEKDLDQFWINIEKGICYNN